MAAIENAAPATDAPAPVEQNPQSDFAESEVQTPASDVAPVDQPKAPAYVKLTMEQLQESAQQISDAALQYGDVKLNLAALIRQGLCLEPVQAEGLIGIAYCRMADACKPEPLDVNLQSDPAARVAYAERLEAARERFMQCGNSIRSQCKEQWGKMLPGVKHTVVSIQLKRADMVARVTIVPPGATVADVEKALAHDKVALPQHLKRIAEEARKAQEKAAGGDGKGKALPAPAPALPADSTGNVGPDRQPDAEPIKGSGKFAHEFTPAELALQLASWDAVRLERLAVTLQQMAVVKRAESAAAGEPEPAPAPVAPEPAPAPTMQEIAGDVLAATENGGNGGASDATANAGKVIGEVPNPAKPEALFNLTRKPGTANAGKPAGQVKGKGKGKNPRQNI